MKIFFTLTIAFLFPAIQPFAQNKLTHTFTLEEFISQVKIYHPYAKQADLQVDKANAELLAAKGAFDPALEIEASRKTVDNKNYYYYTHPQFTVPLPLGNIKMGIENNGGDNILSEITKDKSSYTGIEIPLAKGLLIDKRRAVLQKAKILRSQSEKERSLMFNDLLFEAYNAYWQWAANYQQYIAYAKFRKIAVDRMRLVGISFANGERAMIDTVEAYTQIQNYQLMEAEALLKLTNAKLELENHLWLQNYTSYRMPDNYKPDSLQFTIFSSFINVDDLLTKSAIENPLLNIYDYKLQSLEVERKLLFQNLLPYFSLKANLLHNDYYAFKNLNPGFIQNNYKWGFEFRIPLFLREARGNYKKTQLKIEETHLELINKRQQTENKIRSYFNEFYALSNQLQITNRMYKNYQSLLYTEVLKFSQGESSLFFINSRETKVIEILQKQIELALHCYKAKYAMEWAAGILK